ncbi:MAG: hypothetical protein ACQEXX_28025 [Bacillota bacterium]
MFTELLGGAIRSIFKNIFDKKKTGAPEEALPIILGENSGVSVFIAEKNPEVKPPGFVNQS